MSQLPSMFDATKIDPASSGVGQLPVSDSKGWPVVIVGSEVKATKDNNGGYVQFELQIIDGPHTGATGAYRLNLFNANQQAVEIAQRQLSALCHVTGVFQIQDTQQLHNIPFRAVVGQQKADAKYTEVKGVKDINANDPGKGNGGQTTQSAPGWQQQPQQQGQQQQQPQQQPQQQWGQQAQTQGNAPAWSQGQPQGGQQPQQPAWQQGQPQGGAAPWQK